jgi:two-component system, LytTR family, response regulator
MIPKKIKVLIVDDEPLARKYLRRLLADSVDVEITGECGNGKEAVDFICENAPDLVFLDVQMPEMDGFTVLESLDAGQIPQIIFVTAYEQYAIHAFEIHALDYLLKPFDRERFEKTLVRVRERFDDQKKDENQQQISALIENVRQKPEFLDRLFIKADGRIIFLKTDEIDWIEAADKYVHLHTAKKSHLVRQTLSAMEAQLDPKKFVRIHRSAMVNVDRIKELQPMFTGEHAVVLENDKKLTLSRSYKNKLFTLLGNPL